MLIDEYEGGTFLDCPECRFTVLVAHSHDNIQLLHRKLQSEREMEEEA